MTAREKLREERATDFRARAEVFIAAIKALEAQHGVKLHSGYGPYGLDIGVSDARDSETFVNLGEW